MNKTVWGICLACGAVSLQSLLMYGFAGLSWWAPIGPGEPGRGILVTYAHLVGVGLGVMALIRGKR